MGLSLGIGGSKDKTKSSQYTNMTTTTEESYKGYRDDVLKALEDNLLGSLGSLSTGSGLSDQMINEIVDGNAFDIEPIMNEARRVSEQQIGQNYQALARQSGSDANSLVQAAQAEAIANKESNLASTEAELLMQMQGEKLNQLGQALGLKDAGNETLLGLASILKGANAQSTSKTHQVGIGSGTQSSSGLNWGAKWQGQ